MLWSSMTPEEQRREIARMDHDHLCKEVFERLRYQVEFVQAGLKGLTLINGGAIVALFTVIGNKGESLPIDPRAIWWAFALFSLGLVLTIGTYMAAFGSQLFYAHSSLLQSWSKQREMLGGAADEKHVAMFDIGKIAEIAGIVGASLSLLCFIGGAAAALVAVLP